MTRVWPALTALLLVCCGALAWAAITEHLKGRNEVVEYERRVAELQEHAKQAERRAQEARDALARDEAQKRDAEKAAAVQAAGASANKSGKPTIELNELLAEHPEYLPIYKRITLRQVEHMYDLNSLHLPPDQLAKLKDLLVEQRMDQNDAYQAAVAAGLTPGTSEFGQAMAAASTNNAQAVNAILGPNGADTLARIQARTGLENWVNYLSNDFSNAGAPLSAGQNAAVVQAMMDNLYYPGKDTSSRPANYNAVDPGTNLSIHDNRILTSASPSLSPTQLQVLTQAQQEVEIVRQIRQNYNVTGAPALGPR